MKRVIGSYTQGRKGPLFVAIGGIHGNEEAGVKAIETMVKMLEAEPTIDSDFEYLGKFLGIRGNIKALKAGKRYIDGDLNRRWTQKNVNRILSTNINDLQNEAREIKEILDVIHKEIDSYKPTKLVVLDLHTTTAFGGIFSIPNNDPESFRIAQDLFAPVIKGLVQGIEGTTLHYFVNKNFPIPTVAITFESGQHYEELSIHRAVAAITNCMRSINVIMAKSVENRHNKLLIEYSKGLPKVTSLVDVHQINKGDDFVMKPNYKNFQTIKKGELLAQDVHGDIFASEDGLILMPLYQKQGEDGFFIIEKLEGY